jgi:DNA-binding transcriptional regulator YiaG
VAGVIKKISEGGKIIKAVRLARGYICRTEFAGRLGFAVNTVYNWESGRSKPSYDDVQMIVDYLHFNMIEARELAKNAA